MCAGEVKDDGCFSKSWFLVGLGIFAVDGGIVGGPHREKVFPDCGDDVRGPKDPRHTVGLGFDLVEVLVL